LPADLTDHLEHVEVLKIPPAVARLDWIPTGLKALDASGAPDLTAIPYLPMGLERLNVSKAKNLAFLPTLPSSIRELDISSTAIEGPWTFPQGLESLTLGGPLVRSLDGLGNSLLELKLEDVSNLQSSAGLPDSLQSLSISGGAKFEDLIGLPPRLKVLSLTNMQIRVLKELPLTLESLSLVDNERMEVELPAFLRSLTLDDKRRSLSGFEQLVFLNDLTLQSRLALPPLPAFLRSLAVPALGPPAQDLPPILKNLPRGLIELRWEEGYNLGSLPRNLKYLYIQKSPLSSLAGLPPAVQSLDISDAKMLTAFPKLPSTLRRLRYRYCPFNPISDLPASLRDLDLKGSRNLDRLNTELPMLERLNISETSIKKLPRLARLQELDISNTPLRFPKGLQTLPRSLRKLTVHAGQLDTLAGLPESVKELYFVEAL
jgi:hypothetical protein